MHAIFSRCFYNVKSILKLLCKNSDYNFQTVSFHSLAQRVDGLDHLRFFGGELGVFLLAQRGRFGQRLLVLGDVGLQVLDLRVQFGGASGVLFDGGLEVRDLLLSRFDRGGLLLAVGGAPGEEGKGIVVENV